MGWPPYRILWLTCEGGHSLESQSGILSGNEFPLIHISLYISIFYKELMEGVWQPRHTPNQPRSRLGPVHRLLLGSDSARVSRHLPAEPRR